VPSSSMMASNGGKNAAKQFFRLLCLVLCLWFIRPLERWDLVTHGIAVRVKISCRLPSTSQVAVANQGSAERKSVVADNNVVQVAASQQF
jgi:hypothetical protein